MRAHIVDISKYQVSFDPDKVTGVIDGVIIRSSYGLMKDKKFVELTEAAKDVPVRGPYHYFSSNIPWESQARFFLKQAAGFHLYALDFERGFNNKSDGFAVGARKWMEFVAKETGEEVLLYTDYYTYKEWLMPYGNWMKDWSLWIAQWPHAGWNSYLEAIPSNHSIQPNLPRGATSWTLWQYSADGNGQGSKYGVESASIDLNVFNGTVEEFHEWAGVIPEPIPDPAPIPEPIPEPMPDPIPVPELPPEPQKTWWQKLLEVILAFLRNIGNG